MIRGCWRLVAAVALVGGTGLAAGLPEPVDLSSLDAIDPPPASAWEGVEVHPVSLATESDARFYVTGLLGQSFVTLSDPVYGDIFDRWINRSVFTSGGAAGVAFEREHGRLRIEVEGQARDDVTAGFSDSLPPVFTADFRWVAADGWSALCNAWRDFPVSERVDLYLGGGLGAGGYRYGLAGDIGGLIGFGFTSQDQVAALAWQAGGGAVWNLSERVAFDVGYRFFSIDQADVTLNASIAGIPVGAVALPQQYTASEILFGLRIYEPFRRWR